MPNKIQIKRTTVTGRTPNTTNSSNTRYIDAGELSLNLTDAKLFSSDGTNYFEVGSNLNSIAVGGTFTANATLVNAVALNVVNQTNTATLYVTTSANVGTAFTTNSTLTNTVALNVVNTINVGSYGVTNGVNITNTYIAIGNATVNNAVLPYGFLTNRIASATANAFIAITTNSLEYGAIELGGSLGGFIDFKAPNSDDYDYRLISSDAGFYIYGGSSTASANAIFIQNANVSIDSGILFVDWVNNRVGINNTAPAVEFRVTGSSDVSGAMNAASHTVGTNFTSNSSQMVLNAPSYTVSFSNTNASATNYITWSTSLQQAVPSTTTRSLGTKIIFYEGLSGSATDWAYGLAGSEMWASVGTTTGTFRWYAVTTAFMTSNTSFLNHNAQVRVGGGVGTTNGVAITNTSITVGNTVTNSFMTPSTLQIGSSITANAISANLLVNTAISAIIANGSIGTSGQVLTSNATGIYWSTVSGGGGSGISLAEARKAVSLRL